MTRRTPSTPCPAVRAALVVLAALALAACDDDRDTASEEDLLVVDDTADTAASDTAASDTAADTAPPDTTPDPGDTDIGDTADLVDPCDTATDGTPCATENASCGGCGPTSCTFCNILFCTGGVWQRVEAHPDPRCHTESCSPLDETSRCGADEGCYWNAELGVFRCAPAGTRATEQPCTEAGDCVPGALCLRRDGTSAAACYLACDPATDDGICGGPCDAMGDHGYDNGAANPIEDVGFCYFLGG